uniref:DUF6444 domain-containing protein n=1 Tax=Trichocoleus desertorum TaxID=1481672 RepID=UPI0025B5F9DE|nr:DUF6444 domain-containing protein [Trichocoleus desertorum]
MKELPPLAGLSHAEKDALIQGLWQELQTLRSEVEKLKQKRVKKTSRNSSLPPSQGFKPNQRRAQSPALNGEETGSHRNGGRELSQQPDQVVVAQAKSCPHCGVEVELSTQRLSGTYERNRDREKPRSSPLPHHLAYGSVPRRFNRVECQISR